MKKHILMVFALLFSFPLAAHFLGLNPLNNQAINIVINQSDIRNDRPMLLFDVSSLKEEKAENGKVVSYSKSTEMSDIRKARVLSSKRLQDERENLKNELRYYESTCGSAALCEQMQAKNKVKDQELFERIYIEKSPLNTQEKNVYKKIRVIIERIARKWATSEVISYDSDTTMWPYVTYVGRPTVDITEEVLETLNKEYTQTCLGS